MASGQKQHVDYFRKILLRKKFLPFALPGSVYVPFVGDGDIAFDLYRDRKIYGADIDLVRIKTAKSRLPKSTLVVGDCNDWPMGIVKDVFCVGDFDSYNYPYASFRSWWSNTKKTDVLVLFFTDGQRQVIKRSGAYHKFNGDKVSGLQLTQRHAIYNSYFVKTIKPDFCIFILPYHIIKVLFYLRKDMLYWGAVIQK